MAVSMFESSAGTPTLGSALVSGGVQERVRVHALLQSLAATEASLAERHSSNDSHQSSKPRRKANSNSVRKKSKKGQTKGSQSNSPRASSRCRSQRSPPPAQAGGRRRSPSPASSPTLDSPSPSTPPTRSVSGVEEPAVRHEHHCRQHGRRLTHHHHEQNLAPIRMDWTDGIEPTAALSKHTLNQTSGRRDSDTEPPSTQSRTSICREQEWEDLMSELHYHFGSSREAYYRSLAVAQHATDHHQQPSTALTLTGDHHHHYESVPLAPPFPSEFWQHQQHQREPLGEGYLLHW